MNDKVITNGLEQTSSEWLREMTRIESEGETSPAQSDPLDDEHIQELERLTAADKVLKMRRVRELAKSWSEPTRHAYAKAFEALSLEFAAASAWLKRHQADDEFIPEWMKQA